MSNSVIILFKQSNKGICGVYSSAESMLNHNPGMKIHTKEAELEPGFIYRAELACGTKVYFESHKAL